MKKYIIAGATLAAALGAAADPSPIPTQAFNGERIHSISPNGKWMMSEYDGERSITIRNLETGESWDYLWDYSDFGTDYWVPKGHGISNDGIAVGEVASVPAIWENGEWKTLKGYFRNEFGLVTAVMGGITADGSMVVGGMGKDGSSVFDDNGKSMTYPCVWYRQEDGSYGDPEWLPTPGRDILGMVPQYVHCTDVSLDGNTIAATVRSGNGFWHQVYSYTRDDSGNWICHELGMDFLNPKGLEIMPYPGEYYGPEPPNYETYMSADALNDFYWVSGPAWIDSLYAQGITDEEEIALLELTYAMEFMEDDMRALYEPKLNAFLEAWVPWREAYTKYEEFLNRFSNSGSNDFLYNRALCSPDGKYVYGVATPANGGGYTIVRFDAETGEYKRYNSGSRMLTCITDDYSILAQGQGSDADSPVMAYILPKGEGNFMEFTQYWKSLGLQQHYDWMEEMFYQSVVIGLTSTGAEQFDDRWSVGKPVATPDMSLVGYGTSTLYWETPPPGGINSIFYTGLLNTGFESTGVEEIPMEETEATADAQPEYFDMQGLRVTNPQHGLFIKVTGGKAEKVLIP